MGLVGGTYPASFLVSRNGRLEKVVVDDRDALRELRTELELLHRVDFCIQSLLASGRSVGHQAGSAADLEEFVSIARDAASPVVGMTIARIDTAFEGIDREIATSAVAREAQELACRIIDSGVVGADGELADGEITDAVLSDDAVAGDGSAQYEVNDRDGGTDVDEGTAIDESLQAELDSLEGVSGGLGGQIERALDLADAQTESLRLEMTGGDAAGDCGEGKKAHEGQLGALTEPMTESVGPSADTVFDVMFESAEATASVGTGSYALGDQAECVRDEEDVAHDSSVSESSLDTGLSNEALSTASVSGEADVSSFQSAMAEVEGGLGRLTSLMRSRISKEFGSAHTALAEAEAARCSMNAALARSKELLSVLQQRCHEAETARWEADLARRQACLSRDEIERIRHLCALKAREADHQHGESGLNREGGTGEGSS